VHDLDWANKASSQPMSYKFPIDTQYSGELANRVKPPDGLLGSEQVETAPEFLFGDNFDWVSKRLKLPGLFKGARRPGFVVEGKLTFADDKIPGVTHRKGIDSPAQIQHKATQLLVR
jgi:hypothetical protein